MWVLRYLVVFFAAVFLIGVGATPAGADGTAGIAMQTFAIWPPNYAACGHGALQVMSSSEVAAVASQTISRTVGCGTGDPTSPAGANVLMAQVVLWKGGGVCATSAAHYNAAGGYEANVLEFYDACGDGNHKAQAKWRINYGGTNWYGDDFSSSLFMYE